MVGAAVAVVLCTSACPGLSDGAGADQISTTRDQIGTLQAAVVAGATRIRQLTLAYQHATVQADTLAQQVGADRVQFRPSPSPAGRCGCLVAACGDRQLRGRI
jgi:hypothetical protein